jgi:proline dehydrogenase
MLRALLLALSRRRTFGDHLQRFPGTRAFVRRFVAGTTVGDALAELERLPAQGVTMAVTYLGENVTASHEAEAATATYLELVEEIGRRRLAAAPSLKLTHLGLDVDEQLAYANVRRLVERAASLGNFIRIDMEQSQYVDATLRVYRRLREAGLDAVGTVLQAYLHRTSRDLDDLLPLRPNLRLVKGAYLEPPSIAYARKADVDAAYARLLDRMLPQAGHTAVATHDERLIEHAIRSAELRGVARERFEFQLLYGVRPQLQLELVRRGFKVLVATPFGPEWYPYLMRRLGERPANLLFFVRSALRR